MGWRRPLFDAMYKLGRPVWHAPIPDEIRNVAVGAQAVTAGRVLDLGCGTSGCVAYLARHGWDALGVDFSDVAIRKATADAAEVSGARFVVGDVTRLTEQ